MFSGITQGLFEIVAFDRQPGLLQYQVQLNEALITDLKPGASVAVDGVCQTVVAIDDDVVSFDAMAETLRRTTLGQRQIGDKCSIERSIRLGDEVGGHQVSGHVDGVAELVERIAAENNLCLRFACPVEWMKYILNKGFIALDGASLTVNHPQANGQFEVNLIPETLRLTNFSHRQLGDQLNLEIDRQTKTIVDTVESIMQTRAG